MLGIDLKSPATWLFAMMFTSSPGKSKMLFLYPRQRRVSLKDYLSEVSSKGDAVVTSDLENFYDDNPQQVILILSKSPSFPKAEFLQKICSVSIP